ncbi:NUDIX domain-containing protein [Streptomyces sp. NPDC058542]|uniref:NUDIX domain-containing protein n=1 Tax=Streptomyces sp. NPDC058542 TaxID=3346543 RepID=UPI0036475603
MTTRRRDRRTEVPGQAACRRDPGTPAGPAKGSASTHPLPVSGPESPSDRGPARAHQSSPHQLWPSLTYRARHLLPGGGLDERESPASTAIREVTEELGVITRIGCGLAADWVSSDAVSARPALRFPGEILTVFAEPGASAGSRRSACLRARSPASSS